MLVSPGPGAPAEAGVIDTIRWAAEAKKLLLGLPRPPGHRGAFGGTVTHAPELYARQDSSASCTRTSPFKDCPAPSPRLHYHLPLAVVPETMPDVLETTSTTDNGDHHGPAPPRAPMHGVQFHPESVLTESGYPMFGNWLEETGP